MFNVGRRRDFIEQAANDFLAASGYEIAALLKLIGQRERIHHRACGLNGRHRTEKAPMAFAVEHILRDELQRGDNGITGEQHRGKNGTLRILRPRWPAVCERIRRALTGDRKFDGRAGHLPRLGASI
jgi:hypothetical protein